MTDQATAIRDGMSVFGVTIKPAMEQFAERMEMAGHDHDESMRCLCWVLAIALVGNAHAEDREATTRMFVDTALEAWREKNR